MNAHLHPLRRIVALVSSLLVLQLALVGGVPCAGDSAARTMAPAEMADMAMGGHDMQDAGATPCGVNMPADCSPSDAGACQAMTSCAPGFTAGVLQLSATAGPKVTGVPIGRLLTALTRTPSVEPPPPRG